MIKGRPMKYKISWEFFPFCFFKPPINEKFLALAVPHMKVPKFLFRDKELSVTRHEVESFDGERVECFLLRPRELSGNAPTLVYIHGGGFVLPAADYHYKNAMKYAKELNCAVVFVNYRLAPKHPHPIFFEDCYAALCWAYDSADTLGIDRDNIGIGGDSAGATLAVGALMMAIDRGHPIRLCFQMLPYPFLDARGESESYKKYTDTPMWNSTLSEKVGPMTRVDRDSPLYTCYSPVERESFSGLPPAYIETAEFDCLHDDGILYASLLRDAGIPVTLNETVGTMHGFDIVTGAKTTRAALDSRIAFMKEYFKR